MGVQEPRSRVGWVGIVHQLLAKSGLVFVGKILKLGAVIVKFKTIYIEALDFVVQFRDLRFNQPNCKACEQLELLLLEALAASASNDFADEIEYVNLLTMMVIVSLRYYKRAFSSNPMSLIPKKFFGGCAPWTPNYTRLALAAQSVHFLDRSAVLGVGDAQRLGGFVRISP